jgi:hypothetical protein
MPRMTGRELADKLRTTARCCGCCSCPATRAASASSSDATSTSSKPFTSLTLVSRVRQALDRDVRAVPLKRA